MKIALFGATGNIGQVIAREAVEREHELTAISRRGAAPFDSPRLSAVAGDARDATTVRQLVGGHDAVVSAMGPAHEGGAPDEIIAAVAGLVEGLAAAGVPRLLVVGGAGSLQTPSGVDLVDTPEFPDFIRPISLAHREALGMIRASTLDWTYISPSATIEPGERTGTYQTGGDQLLTDANGVSRVSTEDYAVALIDELEQGNAIGRRITVASR